MKKRNATIGDVAKLAGVSIATISRALHKPDVVSQKTRDKVNKAVAETGYTQNAMARNLRLERTGIIVVLVADIGNPFFSAILSGIETVATKEGYNILIGNTNNDPAREQTYANCVRSNMADGLILLNGHIPIPTGTDRSKVPLPPLVAVCERLPNAEFPTVIIDNVAAAKEATQYLLDQGHQNIVHIAGPPDNILTKDRRGGFFLALQEANIINNQDRIFYGDFTIESGKEAFKEIQESGLKPTAIFCANDGMAMGVISAATAQGISIPKDLSIVGFDDIQYAGSLSPPLTTIHQPRRRLGVAAMKKLIEILKDPSANSDEVITLDTDLVIRGSVEKIAPKQNNSPA